MVVAKWKTMTLLHHRKWKSNNHLIFSVIFLFCLMLYQSFVHLLLLRFVPITTVAHSQWANRINNSLAITIVIIIRIVITNYHVSIDDKVYDIAEHWYRINNIGLAASILIDLRSLLANTMQLKTDYRINEKKQWKYI